MHIANIIKSYIKISKLRKLKWIKKCFLKKLQKFL